MEALAGLFVAALVIGGIIALIVWAYKTEETRKQNVLSVALPFNGRLVGGGWAGWHVEFSVDGIPGQINWHTGSKNNPAYTRIVFQRPFRDRLRVRPQGAFLALRKLFGTQDLEIGDPAFDPLFEIEATSVAVARDMLTPEVKRLLVLQGGVTLDVNQGGVILGLRRCVTDPVNLRPFFDACIKIFRAIRSPESSDVKILGVEVTKGDCLTCGSPLDGASPPCAKCGTRMHRDCWGYFGSCATYGCGGNVS